MNFETLFFIIGVIVYAVQGVLAVWGAYCVILVWRRLGQIRFSTEKEQDAYLDELEPSVRDGRFKAVAEICQGDRRALPQLALYAISHAELSLGKLRRRVVERFQLDVMSDIHYRLGWIGTVVKSAPMIGLLGTVIGMIGAFGNIRQPGSSPDPVQMAQDIEFALITTANGLAIAVPLILATAAINSRLRKTEELTGIGLGRFFEAMAEERGESSPSYASGQSADALV
jgi:biopolymer transport protein ExbB/TolQ